jgi:hypothetical protein
MTAAANTSTERTACDASTPARATRKLFRTTSAGRRLLQVHRSPAFLTACLVMPIPVDKLTPRGDFQVAGSPARADSD